MSENELTAAGLEKLAPVEKQTAGFDAALNSPNDQVQRAADKTKMLSPDALHFVEEYLPDLHNRLATVQGRPESKGLMDWMHEQAKRPDGHIFKLLLQA